VAGPAGELGLRHQQLRRRVSDRRRAAAEVPDTDAGRSPALHALIEATDELLAFEDRLPVLLDLPARATSVQLVRAGAFATALGAVLVGIAIWRDVLGPAWIAAVLVLLLAVVRLLVMPIAPAASGHRRQRYAALVCGGAGLLLVPLVMALGWWAGLLALAVLGVSLAAVLDVLSGRA
jgi:hypothetical protein